MRAYVVKEWNHPSNLTLVHNAPEPVTGPEDVLVDVYSAGLNFFDARILHTVCASDLTHSPIDRSYKPRVNIK